MESMNKWTMEMTDISKPKYPIFIPTKGRYESLLTIKAFDYIGVDYKAVVEPQEYDNYAAAMKFPDNILTLPHRDKGLVVTRNWIWDYAQDMKTPYFWTFDDNIESFWRFNNNSRSKIDTPLFLRAIEDFSERYENVPISGMNYYMFIAPRGGRYTPIRLNTRVYSNMLIKTDAPYRNEGFYNDDTDLCLRVLKDGLCTILFNAFLVKKITTMKVKGGMTPHYQDDGRYKMAKELQEKHPDVTKITRKWGRWQHQVDYRQFKKNKLIRKKGVEIKKGANNYGMKLVRLKEE